MSLTLDSHSDRSPASKQWDTALLASIGALPGTAFGCLSEIHETISSDLSEIETFAQILAEITAVGLASAALFGAASAIRNWCLAS